MQILMDDISNSDILQADHLIKKFDNFTAVNDVSISVKKGEIFGFLGPLPQHSEISPSPDTTFKKIVSTLENILE